MRAMTLLVVGFSMLSGCHPGSDERWTVSGTRGLAVQVIESELFLRFAVARPSARSMGCISWTAQVTLSVAAEADALHFAYLTGPTVAGDPPVEAMPSSDLTPALEQADSHHGEFGAEVSDDCAFGPTAYKDIVVRITSSSQPAHASLFWAAASSITFEPGEDAAGVEAHELSLFQWQPATADWVEVVLERSVTGPTQRSGRP